MSLPEIKNSEVVVSRPKDGQTEFRVVLEYSMGYLTANNGVVR